MTVIQSTTAEQAFVGKGEGFYRIFQRARGNGDIFRLNQPVKAIIVGPQSDFSEYTIYYYDPLKRLSVNVANISSDQPFIGDIRARLDQIYGGTVAGARTGLPGELVIIPKNVYSPSTLLSSGGVDTLFAPSIDLLLYQEIPSVIPDKRPSKSIRVAVQRSSGANYVHIPTYGRRVWNAAFVYSDATPNTFSKLDLTVVGVRFGYPIAASTISEKELIVLNTTPASLSTFSNGRSVGLNFNAEEDNAPATYGSRGYFDYVSLLFDTDSVGSPITDIQGGIQIFFDARD